jgi:transcriptional regulator with XRE-family HTH domain
MGLTLWDRRATLTGEPIHWRGCRMSDNAFGLRLKELREGAGLSQPQLAERAGMNRFGVAKLEQGVREPSWSTIKALCKALGVSCDAFMQESAGATSKGTMPHLGRQVKPKPSAAPAPKSRGRPK